VIAVGGRVFDFYVQIGKRVEKFFAASPELGRA
jgi:hypothetical protein